MAIRDYFMPIDQLKLIHKAWSFRFAFVGAVLQGAYVASPAFQYYVPPIEFLCLCVGISVAILIARVMNQSGIDF